MKKHLSNNNGLTIIEVVIGMVIMACILTSSSVFINNTNSTKHNLNNIATATQIGANLIEQFENEPYYNIKGGEDENVNIVEGYFKCSWSVMDKITYKLITVVIKWPVDDPKHSISFKTIVAE